jgi:hypothetical protein
VVVKFTSLMHATPEVSPTCVRCTQYFIKWGTFYNHTALQGQSFKQNCNGFVVSTNTPLDTTRSFL